MQCNTSHVDQQTLQTDMQQPASAAYLQNHAAQRCQFRTDWKGQFGQIFIRNCRNMEQHCLQGCAAPRAMRMRCAQ